MQQVEESSWSFIHRIKDGKLCSVIELGKVWEWRSIGGNYVPNGRFCLRKILSAGVPSETFGIYAVQKIKGGTYMSITYRYQHRSMHMILMLLNHIYHQLENSNFHVDLNVSYSLKTLNLWIIPWLSSTHWSDTIYSVSIYFTFSFIRCQIWLKIWTSTGTIYVMCKEWICVKVLSFVEI